MKLETDGLVPSRIYSRQTLVASNIWTAITLGIQEAPLSHADRQEIE